MISQTMPESCVVENLADISELQVTHFGTEIHKFSSPSSYSVSIEKIFPIESE